MDFPLYEENIKRLAEENDLPPALGPTYSALLRFVAEQEFRGACHAVTGILHVLLRSQGLKTELVTGELQRDRNVFNHSWLEYQGKVFDIAIALTLVASMDGNPVFASRDLSTRGPTYWNYGFSSGLADDSEVGVVKNQTFVEFMDRAPHHRNGLWHVVQKVGNRLKLKISLNKVRASHSEDRWTIR
ncbi:MAG: hypothetical protein JWM32_2767 [Verrucomicrobia bacterium]|nr:hypothetical protein [Verrucomicrobiota bacterium]